jgi:hypothetical protein
MSDKPRQQPCANSRINCTGFVTQRGNIYCENCNNVQKNSVNSKKITEMEEKIRMQEHVIAQYKQSVIQIKDRDAKIEELTRENRRLSDQIRKNGWENNLKDFAKSQAEIDCEKLSIEISELKILNETLQEENTRLEKILSNKVETLVKESSENNPTPRRGETIQEEAETREDKKKKRLSRIANLLKST